MFYDNTSYQFKWFPPLISLSVPPGLAFSITSNGITIFSVVSHQPTPVYDHCTYLTLVPINSQLFSSLILPLLVLHASTQTLTYTTTQKPKPTQLWGLLD